MIPLTPLSKFFLTESRLFAEFNELIDILKYSIDSDKLNL